MLKFVQSATRSTPVSSASSILVDA